MKEIEIPAWDGYTVSYDKRSLRDGKNFAVVSVASAYKVKAGKIADARIVLGGVAPVPYRVKKVEAFVKGKKINEAVALQAGKLACEDAVLLEGKREQIAGDHHGREEFAVECGASKFHLIREG